MMWAVSVNGKGKALFCAAMQEENVLLGGHSCIVRDSQQFSVRTWL